MKKTIVVIIGLLFAIPSQARIITVDDDGSADFNTIQAAIDDSNDVDIIEVQPGTYTGDGNRDIDYNGKAITVRSIDPNDSNIVAATIIDCNGSEQDPHRGFYFHNNEDVNSVIDGLTITNGYAPKIPWSPNLQSTSSDGETMMLPDDEPDFHSSTSGQCILCFWLY